MSLKNLFCGLLLCLCCTACSDEPAVNNTFVEAPKCEETVKVSVYNQSRASSTFLEENIDRFTATRVDTKNNDFILVSYHGRNKENIGMVQLIKNDVVLSEIVFEDARVNFAQFRHHDNGDVAYIGVDKAGKNGILCGLANVLIVDNKFVAEDELPVYKVDGMSINCIKQHNGDTKEIGNNVIVVASGGNTNCPDAGFTKFLINEENPLQLSVLATDIKSNYRGYWFSFGYLNKAPLAYTYRTVENLSDLVYKVGVISYDNGVNMFSNNINNKFITDYDVAEAEVCRQIGETENFSRYSVIGILKSPGYKFVIVAAGKNGVKAYRYAQSSNTLTLVDTWNKPCTCLSTEITIDDQMYIFAGLGDGVYKVALDFDVTDKDDATVYLRPVGKHKTTVTTESGTLSSINYLQISGSGSKAKVHVAGGYEGYYVLTMDDFGPCDKRK